jgi:hypothetical protein
MTPKGLGLGLGFEKSLDRLQSAWILDGGQVARIAALTNRLNHPPE